MRIIPSLLGLVVSSCMLYTPPAVAAKWAGCDINDGQSSNYDAYVPNNYWIMAWSGFSSTVSVPITAKPGDILASWSGPLLPDLQGMQNNQKAAARYIALGNCPNGVVETFTPTGQLGSFNSYIHNLANVGVRSYYPLRNTPGIHQQTSSSTTRYSLLYFPPGRPAVQLVLLSQAWTSSSPVLVFSEGGYIARTTVQGWGGDLLLRYYSPQSVTFIPEPCHFTSAKTMDILLDPVDGGRFTSVGTKLETKQFQMTMRCNDYRPKPKVTFRGAADPSNVPGLMRNDAAGTPAQGVSVLLEHIPTGGGTPQPVNLAGTTSLASTTMRSVTCPENVGAHCKDWTLDLQASYYNTSTSVVPGAVRGRVEVTVEHM
ncbi:MAG: fimbrial protein [Paenalcaligenes sp.]